MLSIAFILVISCIICEAVSTICIYLSNFVFFLFRFILIYRYLFSFTYHDPHLPVHLYPYFSSSICTSSSFCLYKLSFIFTCFLPPEASRFTPHFTLLSPPHDTLICTFLHIHTHTIPNLPSSTPHYSISFLLYSFLTSTLSRSPVLLHSSPPTTAAHTHSSLHNLWPARSRIPNLRSPRGLFKQFMTLINFGNILHARRRPIKI